MDVERTLSKIRDVDLKILMNLDDKSLLSFCSTSKYGKSLCENEDFWRDRFVKRFGKHEKNETRSWKDFYLALVYYLDKNKKYGDGKVVFNQAMSDAAKGGYKNIDIIKYFISKGADAWDNGMSVAALNGHQDLVEFFISKGARYLYLGMVKAALGGHRDLVDFFISKGIDAWNLGMRAAAEGGHRDLVDFFISKGAKDWKNAMLGAAEGGHQDLVEFFKQKLEGK